MYHFVSGFINVTDLSVDVAWQVPRYAPPCLSVNFQFASHLTFVYTLIIGLLLTSIPQKDMIIILEFPNGKNVNREVQKNGTDHTCKWRKPSFTASSTSPRMLFDAKPWQKSTCCRFEFHLRKIPGRGKCILHSPIVTITWPGKSNLCAKLMIAKVL